MDAFAPSVGSGTAILPQRFGSAAVLGGQCLISNTLDPDGRVVHLNDTHSLSFGVRDASRSEAARAIEAVLTGAKFEARLSPNILQEMWEKWVFIAASAGITCLMRSTIGDIVAAGATDLVRSLLDECADIAEQQDFAPSPASLERSRAMLTAAGSGLTASMLRDVERGEQTEADHILGDLLRRRRGLAASPSLLAIAHAHLRAYEARRSRERAVNTPDR